MNRSAVNRHRTAGPPIEDLLGWTKNELPFGWQWSAFGPTSCFAIDFDLASQTFARTIYKAKLKTAAGVFDMQPRHFHSDAAANAFKKPAKDYGLYLFDSFKVFDGRIHVAINNFPGKQNTLAVVNDALDTFEVASQHNEAQTVQLSESAVNRLPDGTWMAILQGREFLRTSIEGYEGVCGNGGKLFALTPSRRPRAASQGMDLLRHGFEMVDVPEFQLFPGDINRVFVYRKDVQEGERLRFRKLVPLVCGEGTQVEIATPTPKSTAEN